jgi:hypothetical protein
LQLPNGIGEPLYSCMADSFIDITRRVNTSPVGEGLNTDINGHNLDLRRSMQPTASLNYYELHACIGTTR